MFVAEPDAHARCGPGEDFYATEKLRRGQELEVYVEMESGWLGIRPPEGSFCWMPADHLDLSRDGETAQVREDGAVAWIGTGLGQAKQYRWQVELNAGETVFILGGHESAEDDPAKKWLRIAPPSGEFRFVHRDQVAESAEALADRIAASAAKRAAAEIGVVKASHRTTQTERAGEAMETRQTSGSIADSNRSSRRQTHVVSNEESNLKKADSIPSLQSILDKEPLKSGELVPKVARRAIPDRAIQLHRGVDPNDFADRGAVIGSGLKEDWDQELDESTESGAIAGAKAAAAALAKPIQDMSDVVANFISPPRLVEIGPQMETEFRTTLSDQRWTVGGQRPTTLEPPRPLPSRQTNPSIRQVVADEPRQRIVPVEKIARVEDAIRNADLETSAQILSKLIAETASADEIDPVIRRLESLRLAGDVAQSTRLRELLQRAQDYRNLAARRDGRSVIQTSATASSVQTLAPAGTLTATEPPTHLRPVPSSSPAIEPAIVAPASFQTSAPAVLPQSPAAEDHGFVSGSLVQVYSSRPNSPPYALTDERGLTIAYVTPYPGVNLR
ncbi:MAG: hypothetical protein AAGJ83_14740, partial [Planctomycetota bacterium]